MSRQGPFGWCRGQRPGDAARIKRSASADRFAWKPGERIDGPPRRHAQEAVRVLAVDKSARPLHAR